MVRQCAVPLERRQCGTSPPPHACCLLSSSSERADVRRCCRGASCGVPPCPQDPLDQLNHLALVSRICKELDAQIGMSDKTLAEFIIALADSNPDPEEFNKALVENGAEFGESFVGNLLRIIQSSERSAKATRAIKAAARPEARRAAEDDDADDIIAKQFPGLARPNTKPVE